MKKIAIVASEGGMSCAYTVGVVLALAQKFNFTDPYLVIGSSGSSGTLAYYVAKQYGSIRNIWENLLSTKSFISSARPWKILDIDYLIDVVFKKQEVLDVAAIRNSAIKFFITATDAETGEAMYFSNREGVDIFEALRASCAAPLAFNRTVTIAGRRFIDGAIGSPLGVSIQKAKDEGAEMIIAINNANKSFLSDVLVKAYGLFRSKRLSKQIRAYCDHVLRDDDPSVVIVAPSEKLPVTTLNNNREDILKAIAIGYNDALKIPILV
jgi:predicted patatin/cPLA2 family phospholipase